MPTRGKTQSGATTRARIKRSHGDLTSVGDGHGAPRRVSSGGASGANGREGGQVAEMQRRRLLLAFTEVLAENGLGDTTVGRVCQRAGVSRRTFYDLFEHREACFLAVLDSNVQGFSEIVVPAYTKKGRWTERIRSALALLLGLLDEDPALARVCLIETLKAGPAVSVLRQRVLNELMKVVDEGRGESKSGVQPPPLTAQSTVGGAVSVVHTRLLEGNPTPLTELLNPLMSMIVHPYLGAAAAGQELKRLVAPPRSAPDGRAPTSVLDPFKELPIRLTFRTARVLAAIGTEPGASNRRSRGRRGSQRSGTDIEAAQSSGKF